MLASYFPILYRSADGKPICKLYENCFTRNIEAIFAIFKMNGRNTWYFTILLYGKQTFSPEGFKIIDYSIGDAGLPRALTRVTMVWA